MVGGIQVQIGQEVGQGAVAPEDQAGTLGVEGAAGCAVGLGKDASEDSLTARVAALEISEPGSDQTARTRIRRLEDRLAREVNRGNALEQQVAVLAAGLRYLAGVVENLIDGPA